MRIKCVVNKESKITFLQNGSSKSATNDYKCKLTLQLVVTTVTVDLLSTILAPPLAAWN